MIPKKVLLFFLVIFAINCISDKQSYDSLPFIDVRKNYSEKEIVLNDIADVTFLHLSAKNADYIYRGGIQDMTENTILVFDWATGSVLFFSKDGNPMYRFNHYGQGPEEYPHGMLFNGIYDEERDEVYVPVDLGRNHYIQVYSSTGEYKRKLTLLQGINIALMVSFDGHSLLLYDRSNLINKTNRKIMGDHSAFSPQSNDSSFILISKNDGKVLEYVEVPSPAIDLSLKSGNGSNSPVFQTYQRIVKCSDGYLLCNPENDTIYLYKKDKSLSPILRKIPLLSDENKRVLGNCVDAGKYLFMKVSDRFTEPRQDFHEEYYMLDKKTGEVFRQKISLQDYRGKEFFIHAQGGFTRFLENEYLFVLDLFELKDAFKENRLSGELKELVATLNEMEDNDIYMFVKFK